MVPHSNCDDTPMDTAKTMIDALRTWRCTGCSTVKTESGDNGFRTLRNREIAREATKKEVAAMCARSAYNIM
jgi:hypothetical protein